MSIVHHTASIHQWDIADLYHECPHLPSPRDVTRTKRWLRPGSPAHNALTSGLNLAYLLLSSGNSILLAFTTHTVESLAGFCILYNHEPTR